MPVTDTLPKVFESSVSVLVRYHYVVASLCYSMGIIFENRTFSCPGSDLAPDTNLGAAVSRSNPTASSNTPVIHVSELFNQSQTLPVRSRCE
jgi:hypothetical protein